MRFLWKLAAFRAAEQSLRWQAWGVLWAFRLALWIIPLPRIRRILDKLPPFRRARLHPASASPAQISRAIAVASHLVTRPTCLVQALAAQWLLRHGKRVSSLHIGVVKQENGQFMAHAWVECEGTIVVGGGSVERYTPILCWESAL